jgi:hypothetical protein
VPEPPNIYRPRFEEGERPEGFRSRRARIGYGGGLRAFFPREAGVDYWHGEPPPTGSRPPDQPRDA